MLGTTRRWWMSLGVACLATMLAMATARAAGPQVDELPTIEPVEIPLTLPPGVELAGPPGPISLDGHTGLIVTHELSIDLWWYLVQSSPYWLGVPAIGSALLLLWRFAFGFFKRVPSDHCPRCDYNLTGLRSAACPECGAALAKVNATRAGWRRLPWRGLVVPAMLPFTYVLAAGVFAVWQDSWWLLADANHWPSTTAAPWFRDLSKFPADEPVWPTLGAERILARVRVVDLRHGTLGDVLFTAPQDADYDPLTIAMNWTHGDPRLIITYGDQATLWHPRTRRQLDHIGGFPMWREDEKSSSDNPNGALEREDKFDEIRVENLGDRLRRVDGWKRPMAPDGAGHLVVIESVMPDEWKAYRPDFDAAKAERPGTGPPMFNELRTVAADGAVLRRFQFPRCDEEWPTLWPCVSTLLSEDRRRLFVLYVNQSDYARELQVFDTMTGELVQRLTMPPYDPQYLDDLGWDATGSMRMRQVDDLLLVPNWGSLVVYHQPSGQWIARFEGFLGYSGSHRFVKESNELVSMAYYSDWSGSGGSLGEWRLYRSDFSKCVPKAKPR